MKKFTLILVAMTMSLLSFAQSQMSGTYTVGTGGSYDYSSMADAGMAIKSAEFTGDVTLLICTDLTETINTGIVNKSEYTLTIRPDKDENRTITYTTATDNTGPTGVFVIGGDMTKTPGSTIGWTSIPTKNVIVDGAAEGKTTPRLKITNEKWGTNVILYGDVQNVVIKNCILTGRSSGTAYALVFRSENYANTSNDVAPKNCLVENCILQSSSPSSQTVYFQGNQANSVAGWPASITIRNSTIKAHTRGIYVRQVCNLNVEGCTFDMSNSSGGILAHAIMGDGARGTINVKGNKFIKNSTANYHGGTYGLQTITASGGADVWVIENNYFAGYDALKAISNTTNGTEARLVAVRCGDYCIVRHNTFHMPKLTKDQASKLVSASPTTLLWLAGSHQYPVQNNIFVCEETTANVSLIRGGLNENVTGNVFYHKGGNAAIVAAAPSCMTFADLETSYPTQAATSKWTNVTFADAANGDLSLAGSSDGDLNLAVDRLAEVLTDINGTARREKTYAGAYEGSEFPAEVCSVTTTVVPVDGGTVEGDGDYAKGASVTLTATSNDHYDFVNWTEDGAVVSTTAEYSFTVTKDIELTANFQEHAKYTITASAADNTMGYVTGGGTDIYFGTELVLKATAKTGYYFTQWQDGNTDNPRTISVTEAAEYIAEFANAYPRVYAYDLNVVDNGDSYTFTFKPNTDAVSGNLLLYSEDGASVVQTHALSTPITAHTATTITLNKTDLPDQSEVPWAIELSGNAIPTFAEAFADSDLRYARAHAVVDNSPESEYFGRIYVADRRKTKSNSKVYVYNPDFTDFTNTNLGLATAGYSRPAVGTDGTLYLTGYTDGAEAGIFVVNPADLTKCTQFFNGTYDDAGLYKNNGIEIGSSTSGVGVYGAGKDAVLYTMMEDGSNANFSSGKQPIVCYQIGQANGTVLKQWSEAPTWLVNYPALKADKSYNFGNNDFAATAKGVWVSQNKSNVDDRPEIAFVDKTGVIQFMQNSNKCLGGGMTVNADNTVLYIVEDSKILEYAIAWNENTPSLTLSNTYPISLASVSTLSMDYAGNLIACAGTTYTTTDDNKMKVVCFTLPTDNNHSIVPAAKSKAIKLGARYTVTVVVNDETMGEVIGAGSYKEGETAELAAAPAANHRIVNWKNGEEVLSTDLTCSFEVTEDVTINVTFEKIPQYTVTTVASPDGKGTIIGGGTYNEGTEVELKATAHTGYTFVRWEDDDTAEATRTITVTGPVTYTAIFDKVAPRAWAYDLRLDADTDPANYIFTFNTTSAGTATLNFKYKEGTIFYTHSEDVATGEQTITIAKSTFETVTKDIYWSVELAGEAISKMAELTDPTEGIYNFYVPQGVAVDNSPNSMYFGRIYVAEGTTGANDGGSEMAKQMTAGLFVYNQALEKVQPATGYTGIIPQNVTFNTNKPTSTDEINIIRQQMHRVAVDPVTGEVAFAYYKSPATAIYSMNPGDLAGNAQNLIEGSSITYANSLCFDSEGTLYVMNNANTGLTGGQIYKVQNGVVTLFAAHDATCQWAVYDNAMASDGRGGLWIAQNRYGYDYPILSHVNKDGVVDFAVKENLNDWFPNNNTGSSYRGQLAYNLNENILAFAGNKMVTLFTVEYDGNGKPTINKLMSTPLLGGGNIDGVAFDYAGDLYVASASAERLYKFVVPTNTNTCTVPAPESQFIQKETRYTVTVVANPAEGGIVSVSDDGNAVEGATLEVTATANDGYRFVNWTKNAEEVSTSASFEYIVPAENVTLTANFEPLPEITYELNGGVWNKYGWTSKKDMYNALLDDWRAYSGSTRTNVSYEEQLGIGNSSKGIPTTITSVDDRVALMNLFTDATYAPKWGWLATYVDAVAATQYKKMDAANGAKTQPTSGAGVLTYTIGNFFGEDNAHSTDYIDAVDFTGEEAHITAFAPYWGQTFPMPTQPTEEVVLNAPYKEGYEFDGWYTSSDFSGAAVTTVDENTDGTLYAKWIETIITVTIGEGPDNTAALTPHDGKIVTVNVNRNFGANKILTVTLPFDMSASQISNHFGNATVYEFYNVVDAGVELHLQFAHTNSIEAGKPYILQTTTSEYDAEDGFTIENVTINTELTQVKIGDLTMVPVLDGGGTLDQSTQYYLSNNALYCAGDYERPLPGLRAFFTSASSTPIRARVIFDDNGATSIPTVIAPETKAQKIIKDGRLIIIRGEHQYNAQGQMIE